MSKKTESPEMRSEMTGGEAATVPGGSRFVIFDLDGTLIDSNPQLAQVSGRYFAARGLPPSEEFNEQAKPLNLERFCESIRDRAKSEEPLAATIDEVTRYIEEVYAAGVPPKPGAREYVEALAGQQVRLCVASATERRLVEGALAALDLLRHFSFVVTVGEVGRSKEFPDVFLEAARRLGAPGPGEVTVFEDSTAAIRAAKGAGFHVVGVHDDDTGDVDEQRRLCDRHIRSFEELL